MNATTSVLRHQFVKRSAWLTVLLALSTKLTACPLCQGGDGYSSDTVYAYKGITLFLALLPILGSAGIFYWIHRRQKTAKQNIH